MYPLPRRLRVLARGLLVATTVFGAAGLVLGNQLTPGVPPSVYKSAASVGFVLLALLAGGLGSAPGRLMVIALAACLAGDVLGARGFVPLVGCFLVAQGFFIAAYVARRGVLAYALPAALFFSIYSGVIIMSLSGEVRGLELGLATAYAGVITVMVSAAGTGIHLPGGKLIFVAAVLFYHSDIAVAYSQFLGPEFRYGWLWCPLYYAACTMLAYGAGVVGQAGGTAETDGGSRAQCG